jgi:hypothetical protein
MNRVLVNNVDHADLLVSIRTGAPFGDAANQLPIFPTEFEAAQRDFPIVFRRRADGMQAYVLLGLDPDENLFLSDGGWISRYVPAVQRRGPFSIALTRTDQQDEQTAEPMIHVDLDDARVGDPDGVPLFLQHGGNAPYLEHVASVLQVIYQGMQAAPIVYAALEDAGLLQPVTLQIGVGEDRGYDLSDVFVVDQEALAGLAGEQLQQLHASGVLRAAIFASASLGNIPHLVDRKNQRLAQG